MTKEIKILKLQTRIALLSERNKDNGRIVKKLKRQYIERNNKYYKIAKTQLI